MDNGQSHVFFWYLIHNVHHHGEVSSSDKSTSPKGDKFPIRRKTRQKVPWNLFDDFTQMLHVWNMYQHLPQKLPKCSLHPIWSWWSDEWPMHIYCIYLYMHKITGVYAIYSTYMYIYYTYTHTYIYISIYHDHSHSFTEHSAPSPKKMTSEIKWVQKKGISKNWVWTHADLVCLKTLASQINSLILMPQNQNCNFSGIPYFQPHHLNPTFWCY